MWFRIMTTGILSQPVQVGFNFPGLNQPVSVPQRSMPIPHGGPASHQMNQDLLSNLQQSLESHNP